MKKKLFSIFLVLTFVTCLVPASAFAAPKHPGWQDSPLHSSLDDRIPDLSGLGEMPDTVSSDAGTQVPLMDEPLPDPMTDSVLDLPDAELSEDFAPIPADDMNPQSAEELPVVPEETPESILSAMIIADKIQPDGPVHYDTSADSVPFSASEESLFVSTGETVYAYENMTVYNNGGTVYSNLATIYNNGGIVYGNNSTIFNNSGTVYANMGTVYNNAGTVFNNGAAVYGFEDTGVVVSMLMGTSDADDMSTAVGMLPASDDMPFVDDKVASDAGMAEEYIIAEGIYPDDMMTEEDAMLSAASPDDSVPDDMNVINDPMLPEDMPFLDESLSETGGMMEDSSTGEDMPSTDDAMNDIPWSEEVPLEDGELMTSPESAVDSSDMDVYGDEMTLYAPVMNTYRAFLSGAEPIGPSVTDQGDYYLELGETGISYLSYEGNLGFLLLDLDSDGVSELLIGSDDGQYGSYIYDMFTLVNGIPQRVLASSDRVRYQLAEDNLILYEGSGGAAYQFCSLYEFRDADIRLFAGIVMLDDYCYEIFGDSISDYMNATEKEIPITREEYDIIYGLLSDSVIRFDLSPFDSAADASFSSPSESVNDTLEPDPSVSDQSSSMDSKNSPDEMNAVEFSIEELAARAQRYYYESNGFFPPEAEVYDNGDGTYTIHLYEIVDLGKGFVHTATSAWYTVNAYGIGVDDIFGTPVSLAG